MDDSVRSNPIENLFQVDMEAVTRNQECDDEPSATKIESVMKLRCYIDNNNNPISNLDEGLEIGLNGQVEKYSQQLGRNCLYETKQKINRLPGYLAVNFVRFYWKAESAIGGTKAGKAKILRSVAYPRVLDVYKFCSDELKKSLDCGRELEAKIRAEEDAARLEGKKKQAEESDKQLAQKDEKEETKEEQQQKRLVGKAAKLAQKEEEHKLHDEVLYRPHGQGLDTGNYELVAVITHKGRSAEGGHYMAWVHVSGDDWACFDDDIVTTVKTDEILALRGGGDWHTAYLAIYRKLEAINK